MTTAAHTEIPPGGIYFDLSARARFEFRGGDRERFLQGQVSNDIRQATATRSVYCAVMSSKGKMNGDGFVHDAGNAYIFDTEGDLRDTLKERFDRFIIADDVELVDVTEETALFHVIGAGEKFTGIESNRFGLPGVDIFAPLPEAPARREQFAQAGVAVGTAEFAEILRIERGIARYGADMDEDTIPNEAGLENRAISYHKGCYIGQEVISRIKSVGRVNWLWSGFFLDRAPEKPGADRILLDEKEIGTITSACYSPSLSRWIGLGALRRGHEKIGTPHTTQNGLTATVASLPFIQ
ncbi:glycine cleavage T C-terminal barrel domain-containing protein [Kamptonema cortianum]|nr:glycine cleavage T C-terminal barrel domain-containing protein [Oscillatoria laete-virens]MDK3161877.1 glycine cleavage T C-terminal barrel domain-containing protein [Kamptonema cortianum]MDL5050555.1 glycine cleavage T C-terminal barrel domain-containing protein [Oscillatoria amoena NRMC-F 0135]MDL5055570.1 glycine cleavage T C-terminal barrel domain-containing protein [Oscillatoria laete-virens NRMC-F 0139]